MPPPSRRQTLLFSATFPPAIQKLAGEFLRPDYSWIAVGRVGSTTDSIKQVVLLSTSGRADKLKLTVKALQEGPEGRTLIFVKKKRDATKLKKQLSSGGPREGRPDERFPPVKAQDIHGDRTQSQREAALAEFREGKVLVLVATDVAARGLDISGVEHVINVDLPNAADEFDSYVHRIGRTGRAGHTGLATSLYVPGDDPKTGNGRIASLLVAQLKESKQEVFFLCRTDPCQIIHLSNINTLTGSRLARGGSRRGRRRWEAVVGGRGRRPQEEGRRVRRHGRAGLEQEGRGARPQPAQERRRRRPAKGWRRQRSGHWKRPRRARRWTGWQQLGRRRRAAAAAEARPRRRWGEDLLLSGRASLVKPAG